MYQGNEAWKNNLDNCFDLPMGSCSEGEVCELVGSVVLSLLANSILKENSGLYRDNGLILMRNGNGQNTNIEIQTNYNVVDILDISFNLSDGTYKPHRKPNDNML